MYLPLNFHHPEVHRKILNSLRYRILSLFARELSKESNLFAKEKKEKYYKILSDRKSLYPSVFIKYPAAQTGIVVTMNRSTNNQMLYLFRNASMMFFELYHNFSGISTSIPTWPRECIRCAKHSDTFSQMLLRCRMLYWQSLYITKGISLWKQVASSITHLL